MKINRLFSLCIVMLMGVLASCSEDSNSMSEVPAQVTEQSVANGSEIDATTVNQITVTYSCNIEIVDPTGIKLNGATMKATVSGKVLTIPVTLKESTSYTLNINKNAVASKDAEIADPEGFTINFTTRPAVIIEPEPVTIAALTNAYATAEAKNVYKYLVSQYGKKTLTGAMGAVAWELDFADHIEQVSGKYPAVVGFDYIHLASSPCNWIDYGDITPVKTIWEAGSIPTVNWHWNVPDLTQKQDPAGEAEVQGEVIWEGEVNIGQDWGVWEQILNDLFLGLNEGDRLNLYITPDLGASYNQLKTYVPCDTPDTYLECYDAIDEDTYHCVALSPYQQVLILYPTAKDIETLKTYGLMIGGYAVTLHHISISESPKMGEPQTLASDTKVMPADWSGWYKVDASNFVTAKAGDVITALTKDVAADAQGSFKNGATWTGLVDETNTSYEYFSITGDYSLTLDATLLAAIQKNGLILSGHDYTLTGVTLTPCESASSCSRRTVKRAGVYPASSLSYKTKGFHAKNVLIEGTEENEIAKADVAELASYLKALQDAKIPVLFRPFHEAAGDYTWGAWFWWGYDGADACKALWKWLYNTLTNDYGLNNLIWVWTVQTSNAGGLASENQLKNWYPGDEYVDIVGVDLYESKAGWTRADAFERVKQSVGGKKMVALSECGNLPDLTKCHTDGAPWLYYMGWYDKMSDGNWAFFADWNSADIWKTSMTDPYALTRSEVGSGLK